MRIGVTPTIDIKLENELMWLEHILRRDESGAADAVKNIYGDENGASGGSIKSRIEILERAMKVTEVCAEYANA